MGDMNYIGAPLKFMGHEYHLMFTVNVIDEVQDRFDIDITDIKDVIGRTAERKLRKNVGTVLTILLNGAIDIENEERKDKLPNMNERMVCRHINELNFVDCYNAVVSAYTGSFYHLQKDEDDIGEDDPNGKSGTV